MCPEDSTGTLGAAEGEGSTFLFAGLRNKHSEQDASHGQAACGWRGEGPVTDAHPGWGDPWGPL